MATSQKHETCVKWPHTLREEKDGEKGMKEGREREREKERKKNRDGRNEGGQVFGRLEV